MKTKHFFLKHPIAALFGNRRLFFSVIIFAAILFGAGWLLTQDLRPHAPRDKIDQTLMRERLFISVRQDSLEQLATSRGLIYDGPGLFSHRVAISLPDDDKPLLAELDSLQHYYPDDIELDDGQFLCRTQKIEGVRYVSVPVVWLIKLRLMSTPTEIKSEDNQ